MSRLFATIHWATRVVHFSGPGTFDARDDIKRLGPAVWRGEKKTWEVRLDPIVPAELEKLFPGLVIDEVGEAAMSSEQTSLLSPSRSPAGSARSVAGQSSASQASTSQPSGAPGVPQGLSVAELIGKAKSALRSAFPSTVYVYGVLGQVKMRDGGTVFMELAEVERPEERLSCVIWGHAESMTKKLAEAGFRLEPQLQVMFEAEVNLSNKDGRLSLRVVRIVAEYTLAKVAALRDQTNDRLKKEGLFQQNKRLTLPFLPRRLAIITSASGTVINDFRASLDVANFGFELLWLPVQVQGSDAKRSILRAIEYFNNLPGLDAILIFRGVGSQADLGVFNDYDIARAVCLAKYPVVSAIGHEEDQSSVQDVSFRGLGVPKDIGRFFADIIIGFRQQIAHSSSSILRLGTAKLEQWTHAVSRSPVAAFATQVLARRDSQLQGIVHRISEGKRRRLETTIVQFSSLRERLLASMLHSTERTTIRLEGLEQLIHGASPETQLRRGFTLVREATTGKYLLDGQDLSKETEIIIGFRDGERTARVTDGK